MRKLLRVSVAASATALLLLTGCGSDGGSSGGGTGKHKGDSHGSDSDAGGGTGGSDAGGATPAPGSAEGAWQATVGGKALVLTIAGNQAATIGQGSCAGTYQAGAISLKCADGSTDRAQGKAELGAGGDTLTVSWTAAGEDTFRRVDPGTLPEGLPSGLPTELPSGLPTELPSDLPTGDVTTQ
ncbi:hypothetical protein [Streptomyces sp. BBFR102]|uniref:hypothetical protein n=1 Tax=Streptomyces sp. BBFR102 TaxID=3448171 RepID=UPI003F53D429